MDRISPGQPGSSGIAFATELSVASLSNPTELNAVGTAVPDWRLCHTTSAGSDQATLYRLDADTDGVSAPYIMASATAGLRWVAVAGAYIYGALTVGSSLTVNSATTLNGVTKVLDQGDFIIQNQADTTKQLEFNLSGQTTGKLVTISSLLTTTQIIQIPNITATDTLATLGLAQAFTAVNTFSNSQDATALGTGALVLSAGGLSVNNQVRIGGVATLSGATVTSSTQTGVLVLNGGTAATSIGMGQGNLNVGGVIQATGAIGSSASINAATTISTTNGSITANNTGGLGTLNLTGTTGGLIVFTNSGEIVSSPAFPLYFIDEVSGDGPWTVFQYAAGTSATGQFNFKGTLSASSSIAGAVVIGNGTAATSVAVGGGNVRLGGILVSGGAATLGGTAAPSANTFAGNTIWGANTAAADTAGQMGEVVQGTNTTAYTNFTTNATLQQLAVLTNLPAGRWRLVMTATYFGNAATVAALADAQFAISSTTASIAGAVEGRSIAYLTQNVTSSLHDSITIETDINQSAATSWFANGKCNFSLGNPQFVCSLTAYRLR